MESRPNLKPVYTTTSIDLETVLTGMSSHDLRSIQRFISATLTWRENHKDMNLLFSEKQLILSGKHISAIKEVRNRTGCTLREAKEIVDQFRGANK